MSAQTQDLPWPAGLELRHEMHPGDIGELIRLHGVLYAREHGYDLQFEAYIAKTFAERLWPLGARGWRIRREQGADPPWRGG